MTWGLRFHGPIVEAESRQLAILRRDAMPSPHHLDWQKASEGAVYLGERAVIAAIADHADGQDLLSVADALREDVLDA